MNSYPDDHCFHRIVYHVVWCPKRRKAVLTGPIAYECHALIAAQCAARGWRVQHLAIAPDHVHLVVCAGPTTSAADVVKACKRNTAHALRQRYPALQKLPSLWTRAYFAATAGHVAQGAIARYVAAQRGR